MESTPRRTAPRASVLLSMIVGVTCVAAASCGLFGIDVGVDGVDTRWVTIDGQQGRKALLVEPEDRVGGLSESEALPLVVVLHGLGGTAEEMARETEWAQAARDDDLLVVFPQGVGDSWNAGRCCGAAVDQDIQDVAFIDSLIAQMAAEEGADPDAVYLTGYSNGGMLTYLYSCLAPGELAGAASVAGTNFSDCVPDGSVDFMQVSGAEDPVIPVLGGESSLPGLPEVPSVEQSLLDIAAAAGCSRPDGFELNGIMSFHGTDCSGGIRVRYDVISGLGHEYPTAEVSPDYVAVDKITEFWSLSAP